MEGDLSTIATNTGILISIHTLRMEGDIGLINGAIGLINISIHTLRMEGDA